MNFDPWPRVVPHWSDVARFFEVSSSVWPDHIKCTRAGRPMCDGLPPAGLNEPLGEFGCPQIGAPTGWSDYSPFFSFFFFFGGGRVAFFDMAVAQRTGTKMVSGNINLRNPSCLILSPPICFLGIGSERSGQERPTHFGTTHLDAILWALASSLGEEAKKRDPTGAQNALRTWNEGLWQKRNHLPTGANVFSSSSRIHGRLKLPCGS